MHQTTVPTWVLVILIVVAAFPLRRCGRSDKPDPDPVTQFGGGLLPDGAPGPACAAIEAARQVSISAHRAEVLEAIAGRDDLTTTDQLFLVNVTCNDGISAHQRDVLLSLAQNPALSIPGQFHLANELGCVGISAHREEVAEALAKREGGSGA